MPTPLTRAYFEEISNQAVRDRYERERAWAFLFFIAAGPLLDVSKYFAAGLLSGNLTSSAFTLRLLGVHGVAFLLGVLVLSRSQRPFAAAQWIAIVVGLRGVVLWSLGITGFITVTFHGILGAAAGTILVALPVIAQLQAVYASEHAEQHADAIELAAHSIFQFTTRTLFAFTALTGVALTILLQWDGKAPAGQFAFDQLTSGVQMLTGFTLTVFGAYWWVLQPVGYLQIKRLAARIGADSAPAA